MPVKKHWIYTAALLAGCSSSEKASTDASKYDARENVIIVTLDTVRADSLNELGMPFVWSLGEQGIMFTEARSTAPLTLPAHTSLFTGAYPHETGVRLNGFDEVPETATTLAERFLEEGYATGAFVSAAVLDSDYGLDQGFEVYNDTMTKDAVERYFPERVGGKTVKAALDWLQTVPADKPVFLWLHLFDAHRPLTPSKEARERFSDAYKAEVWDADRYTKGLFDGLGELGRLANSLAFITADHGEGLGEHGEWTHGMQIYDSTMRIPLVVWGGADVALGEKGRVEKTPVSLVDLAPTLTARMGFSPLGQVSGEDLSVLFEGGQFASDRPLFMETGYPVNRYNAAPVFGTVAGGQVWIDTPLPERYAIAVDPDQQENVYQPAVDGKALEALRGDTERKPEEFLGEGVLDAAKIEQLKALGYLYSEGVTELPTADMKTRQPLMLMVQSGALGWAPADVLSQLKTWEREWGLLAPIQETRAAILDFLGRSKEADELYRNWALEDQAAEYTYKKRLGERAQSVALAAAIRRALEKTPDHRTARSDLAKVLWRLGEVDEAGGLYEQAYAHEKRDAVLVSDLTRFLVARQAFERAMNVLKAFQAGGGSLTVDMICMRARIVRMQGDELGFKAGIRACADAGGELGPTELSALR